jgi:predicted Na+-dependent transporter
MGALSILLIAAGAILTFAVKTVSNDVDLRMVGVILMVVGGIGLLVSLMRGSMMGFRTTRERHVSGDGRTMVESESGSGSLT